MLENLVSLLVVLLSEENLLRNEDINFSACGQLSQ